MGGRSGGRPATRPQLDGGLRLDLGRLRRQGWLVPGASTSGNLFDWWPHKPARMHWTTFDRKWERASRARDKSIAALGAYLDRTKPAWHRTAGQ